MYGIYGAAFSASNTTKVLVGPPSYSGLKETNILILSNLTDKQPYFDIVNCMSNKIIESLETLECDMKVLYLSKRPLNFSDVLMVFATNQVNYKKFLKAYF